MNHGRARRRAALGAALGAFAGVVLYHARYVEPEDVEVISVSLVLPQLAPAFDGYRIVLIGDVHAGEWMTPGRLLRLVELVNAERPDLIAIAGDFANYSPLRSWIHQVPKLAGPLRRLRAPDGAYAVLGNHDHKPSASVFRRAFSMEDGRATAEIVRRTLSRGGIHELHNAVRTLHRGGAALHICGVDSVYWGMDRLESVLQKLPPTGAAALLAHEPDFADAAAATGRFDLQLSGHSHGGQARLPPFGAIVLPPLGRKYPDGLYKIGDMHLYTNRGLGNHPRLRFLCRPEITIITLKARSEKDGETEVLRDGAWRG